MKPRNSINIRRRIEIGDQLRRLGASGGLLQLSRGLSEWGIALDCLDSSDAAAEIGFVANEITWSLRDIGLHEDFARWVRKWDGADYEVPLTEVEQHFIVARVRWLEITGWTHDLPPRRWKLFKHVCENLDLNTIKTVLLMAFQRGAIDGATAAKRVRMSHAGMFYVLGPCACCARPAA